MGERLTGLGPPSAFQKKFETGMDSLGVTFITPPARPGAERVARTRPDALRAHVRAGDSCSKMQDSTILFSEKIRKKKSAADYHSISAEKCLKIGVPRRYVPKGAISVSLRVGLGLSDHAMWRFLREGAGHSHVARPSARPP